MSHPEQLDEITDPAECKDRVADRVAESELRGRGWFHPVRDGTKRSTVDHSDPSSLRMDIPSGNYGICASLPDTLVLVDIDDHKDGYDEDALAYAREHLPETLTFSSAHDGEGRLYHVPVDDEGRLPVKRLKDEFGNANVSAATWGEVRTENQYIVGAGSQLDGDGCTKDDCTRCAEPDGGRYTILHDLPVATLEADDLVDVLRQDPGVGGSDDTEQESASGEAEKDPERGTNPRGSGLENGSYDTTSRPREQDSPAYRAVDALDARKVAEETIVDRWNSDHSSGDGVDAFYPTWNPNCNGRANVVGSGGWNDSAGAGKGGPIEMAAIDCPDLPYGSSGDPEITPGDVTDDEWRRAYEHLREIVNNSDEFDEDEELPELSRTSLVDTDDLPLTPDGVMQKAFADVYGRLQQAADEPDPTIHDLRNSEAATYTWQVLEDRGDDDVIGVSDGSLRAFDGAVWTREGDVAEQRLREQARRALMSKYSSQVLEQLKEQVRATNYHHVDELGIGEPWVVAGDEAVNLRTRATRPVDREDLALRRVNAEYDPDAEPDLWLDFLSRVAATPETIKKVQEYFGYCLWVHGQPYGKALFLVGDTDSGKGTALKTLETILGRRENVANEALQDLIETRWGKAELYGKVANIRNEVTPGGVENVEEFKELLGGGDRVSAEFKGQDKFQFEVTQKFLFATNQFPDVENADRAFWNRCLFARFPETIPPEEQRPNFHDDLLDERAGILNWMLDGLDRLFEQERFTGEREIVDKKSIAEEVGSPLERLKQEALTITREPDDLVHARDLYDLAVAYADANDMDGGVPAWQGGAFTSELRRWPGVERGRSRRVTDSGDASVFKGLQVDPEIATELNVDVRVDSGSGHNQTGLDV